MSHSRSDRRRTVVLPLILAVALSGASMLSATPAAFASGTNQVKAPVVDTIKVSKCYINSAGQMLVKAASSDAAAHLSAYRPDGTLIGEVQNGGGSRYGGTVMPWQPYDPIHVTIRSSSGGSFTAPTTPFQV